MNPGEQSQCQWEPIPYRDGAVLSCRSTGEVGRGALRPLVHSARQQGQQRESAAAVKGVNRGSSMNKTGKLGKLEEI